MEAAMTIRRMFVTRTDRAVLDFLAEQADDDGWAEVSNRALAEHLDLPYNRQASRHWARLQQMDLIKVVPQSDEQSGFKPNLIHLNAGAVEAEVGDTYAFEEKEESPAR